MIYNNYKSRKVNIKNKYQKFKNKNFKIHKR